MFLVRTFSPVGEVHTGLLPAGEWAPSESSSAAEQGKEAAANDSRLPDSGQGGAGRIPGCL